jgi:flagellar biosynthetic protein FliP
MRYVSLYTFFIGTVMFLFPYEMTFGAEILSSQIIHPPSIMLMFMAFVGISLAPMLMMMGTCLTRFLITLSFVRTSIGLAQTPPNTVIMGLSLFLTAFVMKPIFDEAYENGIQPYLKERIREQEAIQETIKPFQRFMLANTRIEDLKLMKNLGKIDQETPSETLDLRVITPAFMISELRRGFTSGFLLFLPFVVIDFVVASILVALGMMMLPPVTLALPIKVIFFVLVDGWHMLTATLVESVHIPTTVYSKDAPILQTIREQPPILKSFIA